MKKILIIEDDKILNEMYQTKLSNYFTVSVAYDGKSGIDTALKTLPDLIILDVMLPGIMNGFDVLRELKQKVPLKSTPVVVFTNLSDEEKALKESGADEIFIKSDISLSDLVYKIHALIEPSNLTGSKISSK